MFVFRNGLKVWYCVVLSHLVCMMQTCMYDFKPFRCHLFQPLGTLALTVISFQVDYSLKDETDQERYVFGPNAN